MLGLHTVLYSTDTEQVHNESTVSTRRARLVYTGGIHRASPTCTACAVDPRAAFQVSIVQYVHEKASKVVPPSPQPEMPLQAPVSTGRWVFRLRPDRSTEAVAVPLVWP